MMRVRVSILALIAVFVAAGCPGPTPSANLTGTISETRGGPPVIGATVLVEGTTLSAVTDGNGAFALAGVPVGTHNLLAARAGSGSSRLHGVTISDGATTSVEMLMRKLFDPSKPATAPSLSVSGLTPGQTVSGTVIFTINVSSANPVLQVLARFGHRGDVSNFTANDTSSATVTWNTTTANANGSSFINIIAYDNNWNAAEWNFPVTISNAPAGSVPAAPASRFATSVTFGPQIGGFVARRQEMARAGRLRGNPGVLPLRNGRSLEIMTAPANSTLWVYVLWSPVAGATGYRVYRSFSAGGPFTLLSDARTGIAAACTTLAFAGMTRCHRDSSPNLVVGTPVYYQVTAYTTAGESTPSATASTTPTPAFNVNLTTPADEVTTIPPGGIGTQPFSWAPVSVVGSTRHYEGSVIGLNDDPSLWWFYCVDDVTTITYGTGTCFGAPAATPFQRAKRYEWDIDYAYAYTAYASGEAYSMGGFQLFGPPPLQSSGSLNGPFRFTTTP
jgi:hypothetical protein